MDRATTWLCVLGVAAVVAIALWFYALELSQDRARLVLECIGSMAHAAPLDVSESDPGYAWYAAALFCDDFIDRGGRDFGALVPEGRSP